MSCEIYCYQSEILLSGGPQYVSESELATPCSYVLKRLGVIEVGGNVVMPSIHRLCKWFEMPLNSVEL